MVAVKLRNGGAVTSCASRNNLDAISSYKLEDQKSGYFPYSYWKALEKLAIPYTYKRFV